MRSMEKARVHVQVQEFMTRNFHAIQGDDTCQHAAEQMRRHSIGALPVFGFDRIVGMITDRDLATGCMAAGHDAGSCAVRQHMMADPVAIRPEASIEEALSTMAGEQVRRLIVTDGDQVVGIISLGDLAARNLWSAEVARTLAEISQPIRVPVPA